MTNLLHPFKSVVKDRLFYNRFKYSIGFHLDELSCLRELDHAKIDRMIEHRITWREIALQRVHNIGNRNFHNTLSRKRKEITEQTVSDLHELAEILLSTSSDFKLVVSANHGHVYTNDFLLIDQISVLPNLTNKDYTRAVVGRPKNTICLKNPKHSHRSYFKIIKVTSEQKEHLTGFLLNQRTVRLSPALNEWIAGPFTRTQDYFFIDHNEISWLTMLSLVRPGLIRKTMEIIPTK